MSCETASYRYFVLMGRLSCYNYITSERCNARSAINTIQAVRRSVVNEMLTHTSIS